jgi:hypothetical protein
MSYRVTECALCGGNEFAPCLRARDFHYGNPGEYKQSQCNGCGLAFLDPMYDEAELDNDARLRSQGRFTANLTAKLGGRLQNVFHIADVIEVTATTR